MKNEIDRRKFVKLSLAGGVGLSVAGAIPLFGADKTMSDTFKIGGDLTVNRLGFGAMRITGDGIWGWPKDREAALKVLKRAVELGVNLDRRKFVKLSLAGGVGLSVAGAIPLFGADKTMSDTFKIGGDLTVNRLGFGAMRITGDGIWGWPKDREAALKVLKRAVELGVN